MLTKEHRLAAIRELWEHCYRGGYSDGYAALYGYERAVKGDR